MEIKKALIKYLKEEVNKLRKTAVELRDEFNQKIKEKG